MEDGVYCSTAGTHFTERESLQEHYQSEFHRYNLKRKIAGLPPVTREWYEARRAQLTAASAGALQRVWFEPLTKKKFYSQSTYDTFARSKKYLELVKKSGKPAPAAIVTVRRTDEASNGNEPAAPAPPVPSATATGFTVKPGMRAEGRRGAMHTGEGDDVDSGSEWETASEEEMDTGANGAEWEDWDVCHSLFDSHVSASMEENLEYMWKKYGFYLPDSEFLVDPEGLLKYLGAKLQYGHIPLYESGSNPTAKQMASLHGVQRHMVDVGKCKMLYDGNEDEYADYYDYTKEVLGEDGEPTSTSRAMIIGNYDDEATAAGAFELSVATQEGKVRMLGAREFSRYYKQRHRFGDQRASAVVARVQTQYRKLSVPMLGDGTVGGAALAARRRIERAGQRAENLRIGNSIRRNVNDVLPKNVPY